MMSLTKLKASRETKPFSTPIKVMVCGVGSTNKYTTDKGEAKESTVIGLADKDSSMKATVYDSAKLPSCKVNSTLMLLNYIYKSSPPMIIITNKTKLMQTRAIDVSEALKTEAELIANPPPAETIPLRQAKTSPVKTLVSVKGKVISEELVRTVQVKGSDVAVKTVTINDGSDDLKVSLWRNLTTEKLIGQYVQVTNVVVNSFHDEVSVSTTARTNIKSCQEPSTTVAGELLGFEIEKNTFSVMIQIGDQFTTRDIPKEIMFKALDCSEDMAVQTILEEKISAMCNITLLEGTVTDIIFP